MRGDRPVRNANRGEPIEPVPASRMGTPSPSDFRSPAPVPE